MSTSERRPEAVVAEPAPVVGDVLEAGEVDCLKCGKPHDRILRVSKYSYGSWAADDGHLYERSWEATCRRLWATLAEMLPASATRAVPAPASLPLVSLPDPEQK